jgi:HEAT repeat protein
MRPDVRLAIMISAFVMVIAGPSAGLGPEAAAGYHNDLRDALSNLGMTPSDFRIRHDYAEPDVFRLPLVDSLMHDPASLLSQMDGLAGDLEAESLLAEVGCLLWYAMGVEPEARSASYLEPKRLKDIRGNFSHLPPDVKHALSIYFMRLGLASTMRDSALAGVLDHLDFLHANYPFMLAPEDEYEEVGPFELHELEKAEEALSDSVLKISEAIDIASLASMSYAALQGAEDLMVDFEAMLPFARGWQRYGGGKADYAGRPAEVSGDIVYFGMSALGPVVIGGSSSNTYSGCFAVILDAGGDDIYDLTHHREVAFRLIIDGGGNDIYRSPDSAALAGATFGTSVIMDLAGGDIYDAGSISLGAAICGGALLYDREGDDSYTSGAFSQGAGFLGIGMLYDARGNDSYTAGMQSQAFGYVMGCGLLYEAGGNDTYFTRMAQTDILRYDDHYLTLSQGCAFGSRPDYSGGIGLLLDRRGNDLYSSDIFGQGVAYWFAVGAIIDRGGHDRYCSYQYAQGAGIHLAFGLLLDEGGDDYYQSKGVSHGCGHDLSLGLLADFSGNDCYTAADLSQGAGNANGTGILYDADGTDSYSSKNMTNVNGYGDYRRDFGSIGIHIDGRGRDFYSAAGENESLWESGKYGIGIDIPREAEKPRGDIVVNEYPFDAREFTSEELFILCSRGEPRFRLWREYAFDRMVEDTVATVAYLRSVLDTKDARERHTIKDILKAIGEPAVGMLAEAVRGDSDRARAEASWILGLIGNPNGFDALLELTYAASWKLRSSALGALGKIEGLDDDERDRLGERLAEVLADHDEVYYVRKDAAYAGGNQHLCAALPLLLEGLEADHYSVRYAAAEAIRKLTAAECSDVAGVMADRLPDLSAAALVAGLYACHDLPAGERLDLAEAALELDRIEEPGVALAVARLLGAVEPETEAEENRLAALRERVPRQSWAVGAYLGAD